MAANKYRPFVAFKVVLVVVLVAAAMIGLLFSSAADAAGEAAPQQPQCNVWEPDMLPYCDATCKLEGHSGGYVKGDVCCCNSGPDGLPADS